jgi:hypothetical protein
MFDIHAEDDGLGEAVAALKEFTDLFRHELAAFFHHQSLVEIGAVVNSVFNGLALFVEEASRWTPAFGVYIERDLDDLIGGEEAVVDALL